jgi:hypothetical protein
MNHEHKDIQPDTQQTGQNTYQNKDHGYETQPVPTPQMISAQHQITSHIPTVYKLKRPNVYLSLKKQQLDTE